MKQAPGLLNSAVVAHGNMFTMKVHCRNDTFSCNHFFSNLFLHLNKTNIIM